MQNVAVDNQLIFNKDVKLLSVGPIDSFYDYIKSNPNNTWYGVVWCMTEWVVNENITIPCKYSYGEKKMMLYSVYYNYTLADT